MTRGRLWAVPTPHLPPHTPLDWVPHAMELTNQGAHNISQAYAATDLWNQILESSSSQLLPATVRALGHVLQATCWVRVGQDEAALSAYDQARRVVLPPDAARTALTIRYDVALGRAKSWQRLLHYQHAREEYRQVPCATGAVGAATCGMRLGDMDGAVHDLEHYFQRHRQVVAFRDHHFVAGVIDRELTGIGGESPLVVTFEGFADFRRLEHVEGAEGHLEQGARGRGLDGAVALDPPIHFAFA